MRNETKTSYVIYHPNASSDGQTANISSSTASLTIDDLSAGEYTILWTRADNGNKQKDVFDHFGGDKLLTSPWPGIDVALHLQINTAVGVKFSPILSNTDLFSVFPNPFDKSAYISIKVPDNTQVSIDIFNMQSRLVERLAFARFNAGDHQFTWNANSNPSGIYFIKLVIGSKVFSKRLVLL